MDWIFYIWLAGSGLTLWSGLSVYDEIEELPMWLVYFIAFTWPLFVIPVIWIFATDDEPYNDR